MICSLFPAIFTNASDTDLTPAEIDELLKDVPQVEIEPGVYLRDNGVVSIVDIDVSYFESIDNETVPVTSCPDDGYIVSDNSPEIMPYYDATWDLSTSYVATFKAKYRVSSRVTFKGYDSFYVEIYDVNCPEDSEWMTAIARNDDRYKNLAASPWLPSSQTTYTTKYYNLDTSKEYIVIFEKTDDGNEATGMVKVYE